MCIGLTLKEISLKTIEYESKDEIVCKFDEDEEPVEKKPVTAGPNKNYFFVRA